MSIADAITIIYAEDNPGHARLFAKHLLHAGLTNPFVHVTDGTGVLEIVAEATLCNLSRMVLILDLNLPGLSGHEVLSKLQQPTRNLVVPTIILSTTKDETEVARCYTAGCCGYLSKPLQAGDLVTAVCGISNQYKVASTDNGQSYLFKI